MDLHQDDLPSQRNARGWGIFVVCATYVVLSLLVLFAMSGGRGLTSPDTASYEEPARNIVRMGFFSSDGIHADYYRTPGYPLFIALIYAMGGSNGTIALLQIILYASTIYLFHATLLQLRTPANIALAGALLLLLNLTAYLSVYILSETLFYFCLSLSLYWLTKYSSTKNIWFFVGFALVLNYALLVRPILLYFNVLFNVLLLVLVLRKQMPLRSLLIFLALFACTYGGWSYRNYSYSSVFAFTSVQNLNYLLYYAPRLTAGMTGMPIDAAVQYHLAHFKLAYPQASAPGMDEMQSGLLQKDYGLAYIANNFREFVFQNFSGLYKLLFTYSTGWSRTSYLPKMPLPLAWLFQAGTMIYLGLIYLFYLIGLIRNRNSLGIAQIYILVLCSYLILASAFWGAARFRDPFLPLLLLGAASNFRPEWLQFRSGFFKRN